MSQLQHGNVTVSKGELSIALVYRNVTQYLDYDNVTCTRKLPKDFHKRYNKNLDVFDDTYVRSKVFQPRSK